jgi:membrane protein
MSAADTVREIAEVAYDNHLPFTGASVAYYATVSIVPILAVAPLVLPAFGATDVPTNALRSSLSGSAQEMPSRALSGGR